MIYQGEEREIGISIANSSTPETVADYQAIYVYLVNNRRKVAQYAYPETEGFELIGFDAEDASKIVFTLTQDVSKELAKGKALFEIKITQSGGSKVVTKTAEFDIAEALTRTL